ncbi:uncharacterized protein YALI1_B06508g [Yarrowia lipolytica]|uniref:Uncharacterized protein n=1 Tax=Yarrowia lipolytica TaxID=4952 RepID=A0A1D8N6G4_YARLL|nr:hypothetical protein YALI1_B06508g [Yarrowia lipolytica]
MEHTQLEHRHRYDSFLLYLFTDPIPYQWSWLGLQRGHYAGHQVSTKVNDHVMSSTTPTQEHPSRRAPNWDHGALSGGQRVTILLVKFV